MLNDFKQKHFLDANGKPAGGHSFGTGFCIAWQNGPLGRGEERAEPNGAFVETILAATRDRIQWYQESGFDCQENALAIDHINTALIFLNSRTKRREAAGVEGTHAGK